jgi:hypothetical protein
VTDVIDLNDGPINLSRITPEMLLDPLFEPRYMEMLNGLSKPKKQREICVHEAAHALYFENARAINIRFNRPEMSYDDDLKDYVGYGASTSFEFNPTDTVIKSVWAFDVVKAHLVGGIAAEVLEGATNLGDEIDVKNFKEFFDYNNLGEYYPGKTREEAQDALSECAIKIIRLELAKPELETAIRAKAVEAKAVLFDPYF